MWSRPSQKERKAQSATACQQQQERASKPEPTIASSSPSAPQHRRTYATVVAALQHHTHATVVAAPHAKVQAATVPTPSVEAATVHTPLKSALKPSLLYRSYSCEEKAIIAANMKAYRQSQKNFPSWACDDFDDSESDVPDVLDVPDVPDVPDIKNAVSKNKLSRGAVSFIEGTIYHENRPPPTRNRRQY